MGLWAPWVFSPLVVAGTQPVTGEGPPTEEISTNQLELSFGAALLFADQPLLGSDEEAAEERMVAVTSVMMLGEYLVSERFSLGAALTVPTSTRRRVVKNEIVEDHAPASLALGVGFKPVVVPILEERSVFQLQLGLLGGRTIRSTRGDQFFPLLLARPAITTPSGYSMYLGAAFAFQLDTLALIYGMSQRF